VVLRGGPNPLDEEAAVNSALGRSSLTSGFTIWSSTGCDCLFSSIERTRQRRKVFPFLIPLACCVQVNCDFGQRPRVDKQCSSSDVSCGGTAGSSCCRGRYLGASLVPLLRVACSLEAS